MIYRNDVEMLMTPVPTNKTEPTCDKQLTCVQFFFAMNDNFYRFPNFNNQNTTAASHIQLKCYWIDVRM